MAVRSRRNVLIRRSATLAASFATLAATAACSDDRTDPDPIPTATASGTTEAPTEEISVVASNLEAPWSVAFLDDVPLISERDSGRILELSSNGDTREVGVIEGVEPRGEGGLLGIAVQDSNLFVYYTAANENRIDRYALEGEAGSLDLAESPTRLLDGIPAAGNHNGGRIAFGPDGMLYATAGDASMPGAAQDRESLAGKILRLAPDGSVPSDNPFDDSYVWSLGHRNPQGIAWGDDGTMYSSEFGQNTWDELNVIEPGENYGWPEVEGIADGGSEFVDPVQQWGTDDASPSGIAFNDGAIFIANLKGERLRRVPANALDQSTEHILDDGRLRDAVTAPDGSLWVVTNNTDGRGDPADDDDRIIRIPAAAFAQS